MEVFEENRGVWKLWRFLLIAFVNTLICGRLTGVFKMASQSPEPDLNLGDYGDLPLLFRHLKRILVDNTEYFEKYTSNTVYKRFYDSFNLMLTTIDVMEESTILLARTAPLYDYSSDVKGNGYRSLIRLVEQCIRSVTELAAYCQSHRDRFYFRSHHYSLEMEAFANLFHRTSELLQFARIVREDSVPDNLFPECFDSKVMLEVEQLDRECFYGRTLGFQVSRVHAVTTTAGYNVCKTRTSSEEITVEVSLNLCMGTCKCPSVVASSVQPPQQQKSENKENKNSECTTHFLAGFFAVVSQLTCQTWQSLLWSPKSSLWNYDDLVVTSILYKKKPIQTLIWYPCMMEYKFMTSNLE